MRPTPANKAQRLKLRPEIAQKALSVAVLPRLAYGLQLRPIPSKMIRGVRTAIRAAMGYFHRAHSCEALCVVANPGHRLDPAAYQMYVHLSALLGGLRSDAANHGIWNAQIEQLGHCRGRQRGPIRTALHYLDLLGITLVQNNLGWRFQGQDVHLIKGDKAEILHVLRMAIRRWLAGRAEAGRPHLQGMALADLENSRKKVMTKDYPFRKELIALMADGVWTRRKKFLCKLVPESTC